MRNGAVRDGVYAMTRYGIVNGMGNGAFEPQSSCSAEQAVTMFSRLPKKGIRDKMVSIACIRKRKYFFCNE